MAIHTNGLMESHTHTRTPNHSTPKTKTSPVSIEVAGPRGAGLVWCWGSVHQPGTRGAGLQP